MAGREAGQAVREWEQVLADKEELKKFYSYLQARKRTSTVDFWIDVEAYRRLPRQQRKEQARAISERYLEEGAPFAISSSAAFASLVPAALEECGDDVDGRLRTSLFEDAQQHALQNILDSDLHRYHTSKSKPSGGWKRTEQTLAIENYLKSASKRREDSERSEERELRACSHKEYRKRPTRDNKKRQRDRSPSEASDCGPTSTSSHGIREKKSPSRSPSKKSENGDTRSSTVDASSPREDCSRVDSAPRKDCTRAKTSDAPHISGVSPRRGDHSADDSNERAEPLPSQVCTSRDSTGDDDTKKEARELPSWLHEAVKGGAAAGQVSLNASGKSVGTDAALFEDVVSYVSCNSAVERLDVSKNNLEDAHIGPLLAAFHGNTAIRAIDLAHNNITDSGADHVVRWIESHTSGGKSSLAYVSLYSNDVSPEAEARVWKALHSPGLEANTKRAAQAPARFGHKKSRSADVGANTLPINTLLCRKAKNRLGEVLQLLEAAQGIVARLPDNLEEAQKVAELHCPETVLAALHDYDYNSTTHGPSFQPPSAVELLNCITPTRVACLLDGIQAELSWLAVPGERATSSEQYMYEKTVKQLEQLEALEYHPFLCRYLFHTTSKEHLLFFTGMQGISLDEVIRAKAAKCPTLLQEDAAWSYNVVTTVESIASSIQFMRSHDVMISLPTRETVHVLYQQNSVQVSKAVLGGVHTVASRLHNMATSDLRFIAPELLKDIPAKNVSKADVFSLGVILWEMLTLDVLRLQMRSKDSPTPARRLLGMKKLDADGTSSDPEIECKVEDTDEGATSVARMFASLQILAHKCTDPEPTNRPPLGEVQETLSGAQKSLLSQL